MKQYIRKIQEQKDLSQPEIEQIMYGIMSGVLDHAAIKDFLLSLRAKGPTVAEITGAAKIMRQFVVPIKTKHKKILDTCGTGGDKRNTFNISTVSALVAASCGVVVAKHGNRSVSSKCGSADILEALGVNINLDQSQIEKCLDEVGIAFLFAQKLHPAMKNVAPVRKELGVETIFNILGPLTNPAKATHQVMGIYNKDLVEPMAQVLANLGLDRALVVHGKDGLDEITTTDETCVCELNRAGDICRYEIKPEDFGLKRSTLEDLQGGELNDNVKIVEDILKGKTGPKRDIVVLNAAHAVSIYTNIKDVADAIDLVQEAIDGGQVKAKFEQLKDFTNEI